MLTFLRNARNFLVYTYADVKTVINYKKRVTVCAIMKLW